MDITILKVVLTAIIGVVIGVIAFFLKRRSETIDRLDADLRQIKNKVSLLEHRLDTLESTNLPLLTAIKAEIAELNTNFKLIEQQLTNLEKQTNKQESQLDHLRHKRRKTDEDD